MIDGPVPKSHERALFEGDINGPIRDVIDEVTGEPRNPGNQDYGYANLGRPVIDQDGNKLPMTVTDYQVPAKGDKQTPTGWDEYAAAETAQDGKKYNKYGVEVNYPWYLV